MKRLWFLIVVIALLAGLAPACAPQVAPGPTPSPVPSPKTSPVPSPSVAPSPTAKPTPSAAAPKTGGTMRYLITTMPGGFDSHRKVSYVSYVSTPIWNALIRFALDKPNSVNPANLEGDLAEKWEISPDGKVYTFYLRKGVKWHDGKPFTADDVVYTFQKIMDPTRSTVATSFPAFDRIEKIDDFTVKIYTKFASPSFLTSLANYGNAQIQSRATADIDWKKPEFAIGTGPFKFKTYTAGVSYTVVKNPDFFRKGLPYLDELSVVGIPDANAQLDAFATNRVDMIDPQTGIASLEYGQRLKQQTPQAVVTWMPTAIPMVIWINRDYKPLSDVRVRRAMELVIEPAEIAVARMGSADMASWDYPIFPEAFGLSKEETAKLLGWDRPMDQRLAEAKKLMADAGYADGFKLSILAQPAGPYQRMVTVLADILRRNLKIDASLVLKDAAELPKMRAAGEYQLYVAAGLTFQDEPDEYMGYFKTGGVDNFIKYSNPEADKLWEEQARTMDSAKRRDLVQKIERLLLADMPVIPLHKHKNGTAYWPHVKGFVQSTLGPPTTTMERVWLDK